MNPFRLNDPVSLILLHWRMGYRSPLGREGVAGRMPC